MYIAHVQRPLKWILLVYCLGLLWRATSSLVNFCLLLREVWGYCTCSLGCQSAVMLSNVNLQSRLGMLICTHTRNINLQSCLGLLICTHTRNVNLCSRLGIVCHRNMHYTRTSVEWTWSLLVKLSICLQDQSFAVSANHEQVSTVNKAGLPPNITQKVNQKVWRYIE